jgi:hypothetical protein
VNSVDPIIAMYNAELRGVDSYARSIGQSAFHIIPQRFAETAWMAQTQAVPEEFPEPDKLVYDRHSTAAKEGRTSVPLQAAGVHTVVAPPRNKRRRRNDE